MEQEPNVSRGCDIDKNIDCLTESERELIIHYFLAILLFPPCCQINKAAEIPLSSFV